MKDETNGSIKKSIMIWYLSFIPLILSIILFVFCFLYDQDIYLYVLLLITFLIFVLLYCHANKKIGCKDGYTFVQAWQFYKECTKAELSFDEYKGEPIDKIKKIAKNHEYSKELDVVQIYDLYKIGHGVEKEIGKKRK